MEDIPFLWGGWKDYLEIHPIFGYQIHPNDIKSANLKHMGFLRTPHSNPTFSPNFYSCDGTMRNPYYAEYDFNCEKLPADLSHGYIKSTWSSIKNQFMLFDHADPEDYPAKELDWASDQIIQMLQGRVYSEILPLDECEFNFSASTGFGYSKIWKDKGEYLVYNRDEVDAFWELADELDAEPLWKVSGKEEFIKWKKIAEENQRCFEIPDAKTQAYQARVCQSFNRQMDKLFEDTPIKVGVVYQGGGFDRLVKQFIKDHDIFAQGDVSKWDKYFWHKIRMLCYKVRLSLCKYPKGSREFEDYEKRLKRVYKWSLKANCILPWLQVFVVLGRMLSGDTNTTNDNTLGHLCVLFAYVKFHFPGVSSYQEVLKLLYPAIYSDDHIVAASGEVGHFLLDFERRKEFYAASGFVLKAEDDIVTRDVTDLTFLGARIKLYKNLYYVPVYDASRVWSSVVLTGPVMLSPGDYYEKLYSLSALLAFDEYHLFPLLKFVEWYVRRLEQRGYDFAPKLTLKSLKVDRFLMNLKNQRNSSRPLIPTVEFLQSLWLPYNALGTANSGCFGSEK